MNKPANPIDAVTHSDPYPYYADLVTHNPFYYDPSLGYWIASSASVVQSILTSEICRVRPTTAPVPAVLMGSSVGDIFRYLIRMNDGVDHHAFKTAVAATLGTIDKQQVAQVSSTWARILCDQLRPDLQLRHVSDFAFQLPLYVVASLLGVPEEKLPQTSAWVGDFVRAIAPGSSQEHIDQGTSAANHLLDLFHGLMTEWPDDSLLKTLDQEAKQVDRHARDLIVANAIGFLSQTYEATAALIGNTVIALASHNDVYQQVVLDSGLLRHVVQEVLRFDAPVQNTRRFVVQDGMVASQKLHEGDVILVILAAANRDPVVNPNPHTFDIFRTNRQLFSFGTGHHACPGEHIAAAIARIGIESLLTSGVHLQSFRTASITYQPSLNVRMPILEAG